MKVLRRLIRHRAEFIIVQAALATTIISIAAAMLYYEHQTVRAAAIQQADNIANTLQRDIERDVDLMDLALRHAQMAFSMLDGTKLSIDAQRTMLFGGLDNAARFGRILVLDERGQGIFESTSSIPRQHQEYVGRDWFKAQRDHPGLGLFMDLVPHSASTGRPIVALSRRLDRADGTFAGVVDVSLEMATLEELFGSLKLGPADDVGLLTNDGRLIFRRSTLAQSFGADYSNTAAFRAIRGGAAPVFFAPSMQGASRLYARRELPNVPLVVLVGLSLDDIDEPWRIEALTFGGAVATLLVLALSLSSLLRREWLRCAAAEAEARQSESRYRLLADCTTDVITCVDLDFRRTYASPACRSILGYEPAEMLGIAVGPKIHPEDKAETEARFARLARGEADRDRTTNRFQHKAGHFVWVEANLALVRDSDTGEPASIVCSIRDISVRKAQADELLLANRELERLTRHLKKARDVAERANRAKSRFLAGVSHELRTPLNGSLGYAELLRIEGGLSPTQAPRVEAMLGAGVHLLEMINRVLDLTEMETGRIELRKAATDLRVLARACLDFVRPGAAAKALLLALEVAPAVPARIDVDATRLRQILLNLLGNAVKFTEAGSVTLKVSLEEGEALRFEVVDSGSGVPAHQRDLLFQDFQRLGWELREDVEGAGLGLALSARLAAIMDGSVGYEDNPAGGSIFWLRLPVAGAGRSEAMRPALPSVDASRSPAHVLVVDDVAINRDIAASFLQAAGHHVLCVDGGAAAVKLASEALFDVILMDVRMPQVDGLEASRRIRALGGAHGAVPIVAMTAQALIQQMEECRQAGMDDHLTKPFTQAALLASVARARSRRDPSRAAGASSLAEPADRVVAMGTLSPGADLAIMDRRTFDDVSGYLSAAKVAGSIRALIKRTSKLLEDLQAEPFDKDAVAAEAHALAGSAGMFGFDRLSALGQHLEYTLLHDLAHVPPAIDRLTATAALSLEEMRRLALADRQGDE